MAKPKVQFVCQNCGHTQARVTGQCPNCDEWNTLVEETLELAPSKAMHATGSVSPADFSPLDRVDAKQHERLPTGVGELDRALGGGLVVGSYVLLGGAPGFGKSTLTTRVLDNMAADRKVALVAGEESASQVKMRMDRLQCKNASKVFISTETDVAKIVERLTGGEYDVVVVDSIQSLYSSELNSIPGSIGQVREVSSKLAYLAKHYGVTLLVIGQSTKDSSIAGPRALEHQVDVLLYLEGDRLHNYRILRSAKNRFGSTDEIGVFEMTEKGMVEVSDPTRVFLAEHDDTTRIGSSIAPVIEGSRPMLVEVQALVSETTMPQVRRVAQGISLNRLNMLCAVLGRRGGVRRLGGSDIYVNVMGGLKVSEPALDLAVCIAIASASRDDSVKEGMVFSGEVSLLGEVRSVTQADRRRKESERLGFGTCVDVELLRKRNKSNRLKDALKFSLNSEEGK